MVPIITGVLNSSLFYWFFIKTSNCRDLTAFVIEDFPVGAKWTSGESSAMAKLVGKLMKNYKATSTRKKVRSRRTGTVEYDEFYPKLSKSIIDKIDDLLGRHYGLDDEELKYIKNFDLTFRMGSESEG